MELTYQVPREAYIELLADMIRRNDRRPLRVVTFLLLTVVQMAVVILLCLLRLEPGQRVFFLVWSVLVAALAVLRRRTVGLRAKGTLQRLEYTGQLPEDFWKKHRLRTVDGELRLSYGDHRLACPLSAVDRIEERAHALHLYCGGTIFDIVPEAAFRDREAMCAWARTLRELAARTEAPAPAGGDGTEADLVWSMEERAFTDGQYLAYRTLYYRYRFLRTATFLRLAVSVLAVISLMGTASVAGRVLAVVILLLANLENISMLPLLCRMRIRREVGAWQGGSEYRLTLRGDALVYASDRAEVNIPLQKINLCEQVGPYFVIAWNNFPAVILPPEVWQTPGGAALTTQIKALYAGK